MVWFPKPSIRNSSTDPRRVRFSRLDDFLRLLGVHAFNLSKLIRGDLIQQQRIRGRVNRCGQQKCSNKVRRIGPSEVRILQGPG